MQKYKIILLTFLVFVLSAKDDISDTAVFPSREFPAENIALSNAVVATDNEGRQVFVLKDLTYKGSSNPFSTDILLSFNSDPFSLKKDDTGKYIILNAEYKLVKGKGVLGGGGASFFKKDHIVEIETSKNLWLGSCTDLGSFTLEFRLNPVSCANGIIFSRIGYFSGKKNGIEIRIADGRIVAELYRVFKGSDGVRYDVRLIKGRKLEFGEWYHFALSFDRISGKLAKYLNDFEDEVVYVTGTDKPFEDVYEPSFECIDMPAAIIGKDYYGILDEFRISYKKIDDLKKETDIAYRNYKMLGLINREPENHSGIVTSPVYMFESTGTSVTSLNWLELIKENTFIWMEFRISDALFAFGGDQPRWYRVSNNQKNIYLMKEGADYLRGKYYQWRANLVPSPDGRYSPYFYNVTLNYRLDPPPSAPQFPDALNAGDKLVRVRWNKNVEYDIMGYRIYYGIKPGRYDGIIGYIKGTRITNEFNGSKGYIEVEITNEIIEENKDRNANRVLDYPLLNNTVLYFFSISAYDSYKPDTPFNHESALSKPVKARPFAGSEIKM